jgi:hypothetical protein
MISKSMLQMKLAMRESVEYVTLSGLAKIIEVAPSPNFFDFYQSRKINIVLDISIAKIFSL